MSASRLRRGLGANALSIAIRIALQFATLPLLFAAWPAGQVGVWLMLFTLPAYVGIVGTGFAGAGGSGNGSVSFCPGAAGCGVTCTGGSSSRG